MGFLRIMLKPLSLLWQWLTWQINLDGEFSRLGGLFAIAHF
jgi:hypothetical protein